MTQHFNHLAFSQLPHPSRKMVKSNSR
uniref:Uncharacterized protein n=1 Tax=Arundo donax TaxID=35708 RepID=A0A0A9FA48_ARUDO